MTHTDSATLRMRRAEIDDADVLSRFARRTFSHTFAADNDPADMAAYLALAFSPERQRGELAEPRRTGLLAELDGALVGYAYLMSGTPHEAVVAAHPVQLERFYVDHAWHGRGVATALMEAVLCASREGGGDVLWLGVWERNARAIRFYARWGFAAVGTQTFMLGADPQRDAVMRRAL
ncbi:GNAT family N-acetyltransferase [Gemmatimonas sp.]|uniref:GNAT family N-acetyltransferase n=2 Tax=Gemmatimonas sp. TaxID=1962908 RepID=UPI0022C3052A|nr:GNAT family N-acetyltransferase [Gemmatimonas sp.]MCA2983682.1 GNAT family N-acetyltransferase [Gemmatimonas sp.]MCA2986781.1 GNAT family N-acetyltransferase [Gemmatimonas sp.]MCA2990861.1 GNAT family N-acetyltransferase [Gemmatimonas sp.]MCA2993388.1 GNAT family N-acetyltransferase [Gemmatimonas sp.]MCE2952638.1 GNAT family N-acetyltransferase [Gemmatimonas sp.]